MTTPFKVVVREETPFAVSIEGIEYLRPLVLQTQDAAEAAVAAAEQAEATLQAASSAAQNIGPQVTFGKPDAPITGASVAPTNSTFVGNAVASVGGARYIGQLRIFAKAPGSVGVLIYSRVGNTFRRRTPVAMIDLVAGLNVLDANLGQLPYLPIHANETPALYLPSSGAADLAATSGNPDDGGWFNTAGSPATFTVVGPVAGFRLEWGFDIREAPVNARQLLGRYTPRPGSMAMALAYGQSNGGGADSTPVLTTAPSTYHRTFSAGPRMTKPGLASGTNPDTGGVKFLVEDAAAPIATGVYGETHLSTMVRDVSRRRAAVNPGLLQWFASYAGYPGAGIAGIDQTSAWYANLLFHVTQAQARTGAIGFRLTVPVVTFDHGETDQNDGMSEPAYYAAADAFFTAAADDIVEITGQVDAPHFLFTVPPYGIKISSGPTDALMRLARERDDVHFVAPGYRMPYANGIHLSNVGQVLKGHYYGRATAQLLAGRSPDCLEWLDAHSVGTKLYVTARAPYPIGWDGGELPSAPSYGIVVDSSGALTLSDMAWSVVGTDPGTGWPISRLEITTSLPAAGGVFRYAKDTQGASMWGVGGQLTNGASGNICDGTPETVEIEGDTYSLAHFAPPVTLPVVGLE